MSAASVATALAGPMSRISCSHAGEGDHLLEFLPEAQGCAIERRDVSNTGVAAVPQIDLEAFLPESGRDTLPTTNQFLAYTPEECGGTSFDNRLAVLRSALKADRSSVGVEPRPNPCKPSRPPLADTGPCEESRASTEVDDRSAVPARSPGWRVSREVPSLAARRALGIARTSTARRYRAWYSVARVLALSVQRDVRSICATLSRQAGSAFATLSTLSQRKTLASVHGQDSRVSLALVVCPVAAGFAWFLLTPRPPIVATLPLETSAAAAAQAPDEPPSLPAEVRSAPIAPPAPPPERLTARAQATARQSKANVRSRPPPEAPPPAPGSPFRGSLAVSSSPQGAQVFVNGVSVGATPLLLSDLPVGSRVVRVELEGHERWSSAVRIVANERTLAMAELRPSPVR